MKKIFASLPMAGKSYAEIRKGQESLLRKAKDILGEPVELIESLFTDAPNGSALVSCKVLGAAFQCRLCHFCRWLGHGAGLQN